MPEAWRGQLARGGRIVLPLGDARDLQHRVRIVHGRAADGADAWREESLEAVRYVPLLPGEA